MDYKRRKVLHKVLDGLERLRDPIMDRKTALSILNDAKDKVVYIMDMEQSCVDRRPENLLWSTVTLNMQDNIADLSNASADIECAIDDCKKMDTFNYSVIQKDICSSVHSINLAIYRR